MEQINPKSSNEWEEAGNALLYTEMNRRDVEKWREEQEETGRVLGDTALSGEIE